MHPTKNLFTQFLYAALSRGHSVRANVATTKPLWSEESTVRTVQTAVEDGKGLREAAQLFNVPL